MKFHNMEVTLHIGGIKDDGPGAWFAVGALNRSGNWLGSEIEYFAPTQEAVATHAHFYMDMNKAEGIWADIESKFRKEITTVSFGDRYFGYIYGLDGVLIGPEPDEDEVEEIVLPVECEGQMNLLAEEITNNKENEMNNNPHTNPCIGCEFPRDCCIMLDVNSASVTHRSNEETEVLAQFDTPDGLITVTQGDVDAITTTTTTTKKEKKVKKDTTAPLQKSTRRTSRKISNQKEEEKNMKKDDLIIEEDEQEVEEEKKGEKVPGSDVRTKEFRVHCNGKKGCDKWHRSVNDIRKCRGVVIPGSRSKTSTKPVEKEEEIVGEVKKRYFHTAAQRVVGMDKCKAQGFTLVGLVGQDELGFYFTYLAEKKEVK